MNIKRATWESYVLDNMNANGEARPDYSGRMMYGRTCLGVVVPDLQSAFALCQDLGMYLSEGQLSRIPLTWDNMALQYIIYPSSKDYWDDPQA